MIEQQTVLQTIWPVVEKLIEATVQEEETGFKRYLVPGQPPAVLFELFGPAVFDVLLKTVLGRDKLGLTRAVETENGRFVHLEYAWPDPDSTDRSYTAADIVSVTLQQYRKRWRVRDINPASVELPLTEPRAQGILLTNESAYDTQGNLTEPWLLPVALFAGALQLPIHPQALADPVERLLLPGLQQRTYGLHSLLAGRRLWRDFKKKGRPAVEPAGGWAAAVEFILSEQNMRDSSKSAASEAYRVSLAVAAPCIREIKKRLKIDGLDERYTTFNATRILLEPQKS